MSHRFFRPFGVTEVLSQSGRRGGLKQPKRRGGESSTFHPAVLLSILMLSPKGLSKRENELSCARSARLAVETVSLTEVQQKSKMEEADSRASPAPLHRDPRHSEDLALRDRDQPDSQEESLPAGRMPSDAEQAMSAGTESTRYGPLA